MRILTNFRIELRVVASKTLCWDVIRVEFANFFVVELKPIVLAIAALTLLYKTVIMTAFSCPRVNHNSN